MLQESDCVDPGGISIRDTSFSWESIDSQAGSRQSLLDNKGRSRLLSSGVGRSRGQSEVSSGREPPPGDSGGGGGDAGGGPEDMDLTRRQREQRKKDIRDKVHNEQSLLIRKFNSWKVVLPYINVLKYSHSLSNSLTIL